MCECMHVGGMIHLSVCDYTSGSNVLFKYWKWLCTICNSVRWWIFVWVCGNLQQEWLHKASWSINFNVMQTAKSENGCSHFNYNFIVDIKKSVCAFRIYPYKISYIWTFVGLVKWKFHWYLLLVSNFMLIVCGMDIGWLTAGLFIKAHFPS